MLLDSEAEDADFWTRQAHETVAGSNFAQNNLINGTLVLAEVHQVRQLQSDKAGIVM